MRETRDDLKALARRVEDGVQSVKASQDETKTAVLDGVKAMATDRAHEIELTKSEQLNAAEGEQSHVQHVCVY
jgi:hypothetical protein